MPGDRSVPGAALPTVNSDTGRVTWVVSQSDTPLGVIPDSPWLAGVSQRPRCAGRPGSHRAAAVSRSSGDAAARSGGGACLGREFRDAPGTAAKLHVKTRLFYS